MAITFHPEPRMVLMCNFDTGFKAPEMIKVRPVVVLSPRRHNHECCLVIPLSTKQPEQEQEFHVQVAEASMPERLRREASWAKCDMVYAVACTRLDRVREGRLGYTRTYSTHYVTPEDWNKIRKGVLVALGMGELREHVDALPVPIRRG